MLYISSGLQRGCGRKPVELLHHFPRQCMRHIAVQGIEFDGYIARTVRLSLSLAPPICPYSGRWSAWTKQCVNGTTPSLKVYEIHGVYIVADVIVHKRTFSNSARKSHAKECDPVGTVRIMVRAWYNVMEPGP